MNVMARIVTTAAIWFLISVPSPAPKSARRAKAAKNPGSAGLVEEGRHRTALGLEERDAHGAHQEEAGHCDAQAPDQRGDRLFRQQPPPSGFDEHAGGHDLVPVLPGHAQDTDDRGHPDAPDGEARRDQPAEPVLRGRRDERDVMTAIDAGVADQEDDDDAQRGEQERRAEHDPGSRRRAELE
jgi:hypothetical protein